MRWKMKMYLNQLTHQTNSLKTIRNFMKNMKMIMKKSPWMRWKMKMYPNRLTHQTNSLKTIRNFMKKLRQ